MRLCRPGGWRRVGCWDAASELEVLCHLGCTAAAAHAAAWDYGIWHNDGRLPRRLLPSAGDLLADRGGAGLLPLLRRRLGGPRLLLLRRRGRRPRLLSLRGRAVVAVCVATPVGRQRRAVDDGDAVLWWQRLLRRRRTRLLLRQRRLLLPRLLLRSRWVCPLLLWWRSVPLLLRRGGRRSAPAACAGGHGLPLLLEHLLLVTLLVTLLRGGLGGGLGGLHRLRKGGRLGRRQRGRRARRQRLLRRSLLRCVRWVCPASWWVQLHAVLPLVLCPVLHVPIVVGLVGSARQQGSRTDGAA